jgi:hypothetical protein
LIPVRVSDRNDHGGAKTWKRTGSVEALLFRIARNAVLDVQLKSGWERDTLFSFIDWMPP